MLVSKGLVAQKSWFQIVKRFGLRFAFGLTVALLVMLSAHPGQLRPFKPNPPERQHDYYSPSSEVRHAVKTVEYHHWDKVKTALATKRYGTANAELDFILRYSPNHPLALLELSKLAITVGEPHGAIPYLEHAVKFAPQYDSTYVVYGIHLYRTGQYQEAIRKFRKALTINPQSPEAHYDIGLTYLAIKDYQRAKAHAKEAYNLGYPLSGLKRKLRKLNQWD